MIFYLFWSRRIVRNKKDDIVSILEYRRIVRNVRNIESRRMV